MAELSGQKQKAKVNQALALPAELVQLLTLKLTSITSLGGKISCHAKQQYIKPHQEAITCTVPLQCIELSIQQSIEPSILTQRAVTKDQIVLL